MRISKSVRVLALLLILLFVIVYTFGQKRASTNWLEPLQVVIYPVNADGTPEIDRYIANLTKKDFTGIERFFTKQAERYVMGLDDPVAISLGQTTTLPPMPGEADAGVLSFMLWSLRFRYWAWKNAPDDESNYRRARIYVLYHTPVPGRRLAHSYALSKGLLGYVNAFASTDQQTQNNVVIAHELLHTVGATDKYGPDGEPLWPDGYADPDGRRYPQRRAEIMGGRIPLAPGKSKMPESLRSCVIGPLTAAEIRWLR
ncbi:MAG: hypothetical protein DSZ32_07405 [Gammaproteobacteria bacterium]|nr:MAG: hypothetical protein DSZ32_07405 [Gammaproteobacteria bacterium]